MRRLNHRVEGIVARCGRVWDTFAGARLFITGGTGFYGSWLLESLVAANNQRNLGLQAVVLTRNPDLFLQRFPHFRSRPDLSFMAGDVRSFNFPKESFTHVIHAATEASEKLNRENPLLMIDTIVEGTKRALEVAVHCGTKHFLNLSSGAVYGDVSSISGLISESFAGGPDIGKTKWAYGEAKRLSELLCCVYAEQHGFATKSARCFATIGEGLPLNTHFAMGNFISDALAGRVIIINGDGTPVRSYIDISDLVVWLWHILAFGKAGEAYNVGSEQGYSIADVAIKVRDILSPCLEVKVCGKPVSQQLASWYVPSTEKARQQLGLSLTVPLNDSIRYTAEWEM